VMVAEAVAAGDGGFLLLKQDERIQI